jgi:prepilin-type N-terminal cleavage/methylation domain-containing protein
MNKMRGFTLTELLFAIVVLLVLALFGGMVWAAIHFISKFW